MANLSDESLQIQTVYGCDRCFFSSPLLSVFLQHRCSTTGESDLHLILIVFIFLFIRASNSAGKHMAGFCYFTDESGRTKPYSHKSALYETEPVTVIFYAALSQGYFKFRLLFINKNSVQCGNVVFYNKTKDNFLLFEVLELNLGSPFAMPT